MSYYRKIFNGPNDIEDADIPWTNIVTELSDFHVAVFKDSYPVTEGHLLFVPKYNQQSILSEAFDHAVHVGLESVRSGKYDGFNVGINIGKSAGQTVEWPHIHLIPRRTGDMEDPTGGVRHVIPEKGNYKKI